MILTWKEWKCSLQSGSEILPESFLAYFKEKILLVMTHVELGGGELNYPKN